jgi:hypothetical protein
MEATTFTNKINILSDLWISYRDESEFTDFIEYNDLGLPLAYLIGAGIVKTTDMADNLINETFDLLLAGLGIEDEGFESLEDIWTV